MKLSEIKDENALEALAKIIEPAAEIMADPDVKAAYKESTKAHAASVIIKNHKTAVFEIMAALEGVPTEEYHLNILTIPAKILEILNDPDLMQLFG